MTAKTPGSASISSLTMRSTIEFRSRWLGRVAVIPRITLSHGCQVPSIMAADIAMSSARALRGVQIPGVSVSSVSIASSQSVIAVARRRLQLPPETAQTFAAPAVRRRSTHSPVPRTDRSSPRWSPPGREAVSAGRETAAGCGPGSSPSPQPPDLGSLSYPYPVPQHTPARAFRDLDPGDQRQFLRVHTPS